MSTEASCLLVNTMLLSLITILAEAFVAGGERYRRSCRLMNCLQAADSRKTKSIDGMSSQPSPASPPDSNTTPRSNEFAAERTAHELSRLSDKRSDDKSKPDKAKQSYRSNTNTQIPGIVYVLAYISLVFISLFLIFRFRSLIKLYTLAYAMIVMTATFLLLQHIIACTSKLFGSAALTDGPSPTNSTREETSSASHLEELEGRDSSNSSSSIVGASAPAGRVSNSNKTKLNKSKKYSEPPKFKSKLAVGLIYGLNLAISAVLAHVWFANQLNGCFWLYHNLLGILVCSLVCALCVSVLKPISCRQLFIALAVLTTLDLVSVHALRPHGIRMNEIIREQKLDKRDLNDVEELNVGQNSISRVNLSDDEAGGSDLHKRISQITNSQNKLYRLPSIFFLPKSHSRCVDLKSTAKLGFGDLIIAGIIASFCFYFDKMKRTNLVYFLASLFASLTGLALMLFVDDLLQTNGQPVLVFIVPINFMALASLAYGREESEEFWRNSCDGVHTDTFAETFTETVNQEEVPFEVF